MERAEHDFNLETAPLPEFDVGAAKPRRERIVGLSRERYARRREDVERELAAARGGEQSPESPGKRPPRRFGPPGRGR